LVFFSSIHIKMDINKKKKWSLQMVVYPTEEKALTSAPNKSPKPNDNVHR
jgi:hypothetical protein